MNGIDLDSLMSKLLKKGFQEVAMAHYSLSTQQLRFSQNSKDLHNTWRESSVMVFAATGKKTVSTIIKDFSRLDESVDKLWSVSHKIPDNPAFEGLNPAQQGAGKPISVAEKDYDLQDLALGMINGALSGGAERTAGLLYNRRGEITIKTNYNECTFPSGGMEAVIRSFKGEQTGQEGLHFGPNSRIDSGLIEQVGRDSAYPLGLSTKIQEIEPGRTDVLMSPYVIGNLISYSSSFLSYYAVESGLSCFADSLGMEVSDEGFTLVDEPRDSNGVGYRFCDDEGTATRNNILIENGVLKQFMHSYSTSRRANAETTGNAGILSPRAWQLKIRPGNRTSESILDGMKDGLYINNCWYTRYQDYRNGVFSTVPRDGVFLVKNGEIAGSVKGIRISDSIPNVLKSVRDISKNMKNVKWWEEISASTMPYVLAEGLNISRAF